MIHDNSLAAYRSEEPKLSKRAEAIYQWILEHGPHTDREVSKGMGFGQDMNACRPRITELIDAKRLMEVCSRRCPVTGKTVRVVDVSRPRGQLSFAPETAGMPAASVQGKAIGQVESVGTSRVVSSDGSYA